MVGSIIPIDPLMILTLILIGVNSLIFINWIYFLIAMLSFVAAVYYLSGTLLADKTIPGFATTIIVVLFLGGVQLVTLGILGEYVGRVYRETKHRPLYVVGKRYGFPTDEQWRE